MIEIVENENLAAYGGKLNTIKAGAAYVLAFYFFGF
jgi:hypothetical protein